MATRRHGSDERVIDWIVGVSDSGEVESDVVVVTCLDPSSAKIVDEPLITFISSWIVVISYKNTDYKILFVNFCPVTHFAYLTITTPEPPPPESALPPPPPDPEFVAPEVGDEVFPVPPPPDPPAPVPL